MKKIILLFTFICISAFIHPVNAQSVSLSLTPPLVEAVIKPGKSILIAYTLKNMGDPAIIHGSIKSFKPRGQTGQIQLLNKIEGPVRFNLDNDNIKLDTPFFINSKESVQFLVKMRVPEGAPAGDYYYTFVVTTAPPENTFGGSVSKARVTIGSNILISVSQDGILEAKTYINQFNVIPTYQLKLFGKPVHIFESSDSIPVRITLFNEGNNIVKPVGNITLKGGFGEKKTFDVVPQNILARSERLLIATPSAQINCENSKKKMCQIPTSFIIKGFYVGKYSLSAHVSPGEGISSSVKEITFYAFPIKYTIGIVITLIIVLSILKSIKRED